MFKNVTISFLLLFSFNVASEEFYELPNEVWSCWGDTPTFSISPNGKYLAIMRSPREDVCDIEQDKIKRTESLKQRISMFEAARQKSNAPPERTTEAPASLSGNLEALRNLLKLIRCICWTQSKSQNGTNVSTINQ